MTSHTRRKIINSVRRTANALVSLIQIAALLALLAAAVWLALVWK